MQYQPWVQYPRNYGSHNSLLERTYKELEKREPGVEEEDEDCECRQQEMEDIVTLPMTNATTLKAEGPDTLYPDGRH